MNITDLPEKLSTGCNGFDAFLGGGLEPKIITQFVGEGGCGKSTLCLCAAVSALSQGIGVIYIDTEGFSIDRFCQIAGDNADTYAKSLFISEPATFEEQGAAIIDAEKLLKTGKAGLIIVDSATALYRMESSEKDAVSILSKQMMTLLGMAKRYEIPTLITNQVFMDIEHQKLCGLGGTSLMHISKVIVNVEKHCGYRKAVILKHRSEEEGKSWNFVLTNTGIEEKAI
ncbi:MAG TPA: DNA repair and recombination protein RadB [Methanocorpusculum sp.]|nr:DNA repair and recombination protein RadB [Methanocorpusculum sp.]